MAEKRRFKRKKKEEELTEEELEKERGAPLPDREALSTIDANVAIPADPAIAADVLSGGGEADTEEPAEESEAPPDE
jgi:hypothetical protein